MDVLSQAKYEDMTEEQKMLIDTIGAVASWTWCVSMAARMSTFPRTTTLYALSVTEISETTLTAIILRNLRPNTGLPLHESEASSRKQKALERGNPG